jgi:hypothetical protein
MELNQYIDTAQKFKPTQQQASMEQDNANKTAFAMKMIERLPQEQIKAQETPRIPSLGALAIPN